MLKKLWSDDAGFVVTIELVLVITIGSLCLIVGLSEVAVAVNTELNDISGAVGALNQSYRYVGFTGDDPAAGKAKSSSCGTMWVDSEDDCDCNTSCDLIVAVKAGKGG